MSFMAWLSVLKLSALWQMDRLQNIAIDEMSALQKKAKQIHWISLLDMSTRHWLPAGRKLAIEELSTRGGISAETMLVLAREYQTKALFLKGCQDFVNKPEEYRFNDDMLAKLDMATVVKLFYCRERGSSDEDAICEEFEGLLKEMKDD